MSPPTRYAASRTVRRTEGGEGESSRQRREGARASPPSPMEPRAAPVAAAVAPLTAAVPLSPSLHWSSPTIVIEGPAERENERGLGSSPGRGAMFHATVATSSRPPLRGFRCRRSSAAIHALRSLRRSVQHHQH
ncbi:hypothetical protein AHAS_Ahas11G0173200 [Arachis hypogaea]